MTTVYRMLRRGGTSCAATFREGDHGPRPLPNPRRPGRHYAGGWEWGYGGAGPLQLGYALLCHALGDPEEASAHYRAYCADVVATHDEDEWETTREEIRRWHEGRAGRADVPPAGGPGGAGGPGSDEGGGSDEPGREAAAGAGGEPAGGAGAGGQDAGGSGGGGGSQPGGGEPVADGGAATEPDGVPPGAGRAGALGDAPGSPPAVADVEQLLFDVRHLAAGRMEPGEVAQLLGAVRRYGRACGEQQEWLLLTNLLEAYGEAPDMSSWDPEAAVMFLRYLLSRVRPPGRRAGR